MSPRPQCFSVTLERKQYATHPKTNISEAQRLLNIFLIFILKVVNQDRVTI